MSLYRPALLEFTQGTSSRETTSLVDGLPVAVSWSRSHASTGERASNQELSTQMLVPDCSSIVERPAVQLCPR